MAKNDNPTRIVIPKARLSYPSLVNPTSFGDSEKEYYDCTLIIPKGSKGEQRVKSAYKAAIEAGLDKKTWGGKDPSKTSKFRSPISDGDEAVDEHPEYEGCITIHPKCFVPNKPSMFDADGMPEDGTGLYAGCWVKAIVDFYPYNNKGMGIALSLGGLQFLEDDEPFSGRITSSQAADMFDSDDDDDDDDDI